MSTAHGQVERRQLGKRWLGYVVALMVGGAMIVGSPPTVYADPADGDPSASATASDPTGDTSDLGTPTDPGTTADPGTPSDTGTPTDPGTTVDPGTPIDPGSTDPSDGPLLAATGPVTVTLDYNGGDVIATLPSIQLVIGAPIAGLPTPTRNLNWFQGWFTAATGGTKMSNGDILVATGDFTLYAQWIAGTRYTFNANGGSMVATIKDVAAGTHLGTMPGATRAYYVRTGWYTKAVGGTKVNSASVASKTIGKTQVLYAHWERSRHIKFNANGGTTTAAYKDVKKGAKVSTLPTATRANYHFSGWYTAKSGGSKVSINTYVAKTSGTTTYYARWAAVVKYIFDPNGGKVSTTEKTAKGGFTIGTLPTPTRSGFSFMGWRTAKQHGGTHITASSKPSNTPRTITLYARWAPKPYYQSDPRWGANRYSVGTMAGNGCGPTAAAIAVAAYLNDASITPWTAASWSMNHGYTQSEPGRTKPSFFLDWPRSKGVSITRIPGGSNASADAAALAAVKAGKWVMAFMRPGRWAHNGHYIIWYDYIGNNALIRDPVGNLPLRNSGPIKLLQQQAWTYYIIDVPDSRKLWAV